MVVVFLALLFLLGVVLPIRVAVAATADTAVVPSSKIRFVVERVGPLWKPDAVWRYYYDYAAATDPSRSCCETAVLLGVGTAMSVGDYHALAQTVVQENPGLVFVVLDQAVGNPVKLFEDPFAKYANQSQQDIQAQLPQCCGAAGPPQRWIIGGHSASGRAAALAIQHGLMAQAHAFLGLAPYLPFTGHANISIPSVSWGFLKESCLVSPPEAALKAYSISNPEHRVIYQVATDNKDIIFNGGHCTFTNTGCLTMCKGDRTTPDMTSIMHEWVAHSVRVLVDALTTQDFDRDKFEAVVHDSARIVRVAVNQDVSPMLHDLEPPVFANQWGAEFTKEYWGNNWFQQSSNTGGMYYDIDAGSMLERHDFGQMDNWCRCAGPDKANCKILSFAANNTNAYQGKSSIYVVINDKDCCLLFHDLGGPLQPDWLSSPNVVQGPPAEIAGQICYGFTNTKPGNTAMMTGDTWYVTKEGVPCMYKDDFKELASFAGLAHYFSFDKSTYVAGKGSFDESVFALPDGGVDKCAKPCAVPGLATAKPWCKSIYSSEPDQDQ